MEDNAYKFNGYDIIREGYLWHIVAPNGEVIDWGNTIKECKIKILMALRDQARRKK